MIPLPGSASQPAGGFTDVLALDELPSGTQRVVRLGMDRVLLCRTEQAIHAVSDVCPHALQPLCGGEVSSGAIRCPRHGAQFDLASGRPLNAVTPRALRVFRLRIESGRIHIARPE